MTKQYFTELTEYNVWANNAICGWLEKISDEQWEQNIVSSFKSIYETILHTASAEKVWVERFKKYPKPDILTETFKGPKAELIKVWKELSLALKDFILEMPDDLLPKKLLFKNIKGVEFNLPYYQLLAHVINHSTYHRGQVVTMLRQVGFTDISSIDMTTYFRIKTDETIQVINN